MVPLFHPRQMNWEEHFNWNEDVTQMIGTTPIGCATITLFQTNRDGVVNIRRVLAIMGYHPPSKSLSSPLQRWLQERLQPISRLMRGSPYPDRWVCLLPQKALDILTTWSVLPAAKQDKIVHP
jgi:hypothetical protein